MKLIDRVIVMYFEEKVRFINRTLFFSNSYFLRHMLFI